MEHSVPEQIFSTEDSPAQGISAVKALALASAQGQKIWTIDQNNATVALNSVNLNNDIEMEIRNAVNAGKIATVHESPVAFAGTTMVGYILLDPETGAGAYKIGTGENGGIILSIFNGMLGFTALIFTVPLALFVGATVAAMLLVAFVYSIIFIELVIAGVDSRQILAFFRDLSFAVVTFAVGAILFGASVAAFVFSMIMFLIGWVGNLLSINNQSDLNIRRWYVQI